MSLAEFEGVAKSKSFGRKPTARAKSDLVLELTGQGLTRRAVAKELGIGVASVYRTLKSN